MDGDTGDHLGFLDVSGISGGTFDLNNIGVADDGAIYAGNLTTDAGSAPYRVYRWADEAAAPVEIYSGQPGSAEGGRWGDNFAIRGAGEETRILLLSHASLSDSQQTILHPSTGAIDVFEALPLPPEIASMGIGTSFGAGAYFWATRRGIPLNEVSFDPQAESASLARSFGTLDDDPVDDILVDMSLIDVQPEQNLISSNSATA